MTTADKRKKKRPPSFRFLPEVRAKRLKKSWVQDRKIRSKWTAQKTRESLANRPSAPAGDTPNDRRDSVDAAPVSDTNRLPTPDPAPDKQSLRHLRRIAYSPDLSHRGGKSTTGHGSGQPNMNLRMRVLLEKIKRDF